MNAAVLNNNNVSLALISTPNTSFTITDNNPQADDRIVAGFINLNYPRQFNFGDSNGFAFTLPATAQGNYLKITGFSGAGATPVLYDLVNNKRYTANTTLPGILQFVLLPSALERNLVLVSENAIYTVNNFTQRSFQNFSAAEDKKEKWI